QKTAYEITRGLEFRRVLFRSRADAPTLDACTAFGPADLVSERIEGYVRGGGSKFVLRPMCPPERMLDQLERLAADVIPAFHTMRSEERRVGKEGRSRRAPQQA